MRAASPRPAHPDPMTSQARGTGSPWVPTAVTLVLAVTLLVGAVAALSAVMWSLSDSHTLRFVCSYVQIAMSLTAPLVGVLLVHHARCIGGRAALVAAYRTAMAVAVGIAVIGLAMSVWLLKDPDPYTSGHRWEDAGAIVVGSVLVQVITQLTGTGVGLLVRWPAVACLLVLVLQLGADRLFHDVGALRPAQAWLTLSPSAGPLLEGEMTGMGWVQSSVVVALWVGLNLLGARAVSRRRSRMEAAAPTQLDQQPDPAP